MSSVLLRLYIIWIFAVIVFLTWCGRAEAKVTQLSLELKRLPFNRDYFIPERTIWDAETNLLWDVSLGRWFIENDITGRTADSRYRYVSWQFTTGINITPYLDLVWDHHSEHRMDTYSDKYPVRDAYGIRINFVEGK
jgi:hypothetical protein